MQTQRNVVSPQGQYDRVPQALKDRDQWVTYRSVDDKAPLRLDGRGPASSTDASTWSGFDPSRSRLGYVFSADDPYAGVDLDDCRNPVTGELAAWASEALEHFAGAYTEVSPSGGGVKVFSIGHVGRGRNIPTEDGGHFEIYDRSRYFTVTGEGEGELVDIQSGIDWLLERWGAAPVSGDDGDDDEDDDPLIAEELPQGLGDDQVDRALCRVLAGVYEDDRSGGLYHVANAIVRQSHIEGDPFTDDNADRLAAYVKGVDEDLVGKFVGRGDANRRYREIARRAVRGLFSHRSHVSQARNVGDGEVLSSHVSHSHVDLLFPRPPDAAAFHGLAGRIVEAAGPHSEADPVAILASVLDAFGVQVGQESYIEVGGVDHYPREDVTLVGASSKARKGDSFSIVRKLFERVDGTWSKRVASGLSSGEGVIHAVRDEVAKYEAIRRKGLVDGYQWVIEDPGVTDKRLLVVEEELARALRAMERQGNTLSPLLRHAWDHGNLETMTRHPIRATGAHIGIIAHTTEGELKKTLPDVEMANGFGNRFLWFCVQRSKMLAHPLPFKGPEVDALADQLAEAVEVARGIGRVGWSPEAYDRWEEVYPELSAARDDVVGAMTARAEAHTVRLAMLYALMDGESEIGGAHLEAALALWDYSRRSVEYLFGHISGNELADRILAALMERPMTRTDISNFLQRHAKRAAIDEALGTLEAQGRVERWTEATGGRHRELWGAKHAKDASKVSEGE